MSLLLALLHQAGLSVNQNSDNGAVLLDMGQVFLDILPTHWVLPFLGVLGECLLLRSVPARGWVERDNLVNKAVSS